MLETVYTPSINSTIETKARTNSIHTTRPKTFGRIFNPPVVEPGSTGLEGMSGVSQARVSQWLGHKAGGTFVSHLAGARGWFYDVFMLFSIKHGFVMSIQFWALAPNRHNPGRQVNSHSPGRRERGAEHPTSHTDIKSEHVKSYSGRRHLASHPNAVASYLYKSHPFAYPESCALVPTEVDSIPYPNSIFAKLQHPTFRRTTPSLQLLVFVIPPINPDWNSLLFLKAMRISPLLQALLIDHFANDTVTRIPVLVNHVKNSLTAHTSIDI